MKKVLLVTEYLNPPYDEGIKKTVYNLFSELDSNFELLTICRYGFEKENIIITNSNKLFLSYSLFKIIKDFNPHSVIYFPFQSSTFASYLRLKVLSLICRTKKILFITLQPKPLSTWQKKLIPFLKPKFAFTPSPSLHNFWNKVGIKNNLVTLLTDLSKFKPVTNKDVKYELRKKYGFQQNVTIITHMGHLNEGRNLKTLLPLQSETVQVVIVSSSSTPDDALGHISLKKELLNSGIFILDKYIEHIEELYQLSDLYIFPVIDENSSIGLPLSVLEARACGIPVITTDYGSLKYFLGDDGGCLHYASPENFHKTVKQVLSNKNDCKKTNVSELNNKFFEIIFSKINN